MAAISAVPLVDTALAIPSASQRAAAGRLRVPHSSLSRSIVSSVSAGLSDAESSPPTLPLLNSPPEDWLSCADDSVPMSDSQALQPGPFGYPCPNFPTAAAAVSKGSMWFVWHSAVDWLAGEAMALPGRPMAVPFAALCTDSLGVPAVSRASGAAIADDDDDAAADGSGGGIEGDGSSEPRRDEAGSSAGGCPPRERWPVLWRSPCWSRARPSVPAPARRSSKLAEPLRTVG
eukprot:scaffold29150_cov35-Prasinocladus_malaysianus.AAC.2